MANIWEKAISILAGNLNLGCSDLITIVTHLVRLSVYRIMSAKKFSCVFIEQLHWNTTGGVAMTSGINQMNPVISSCISGTATPFSRIAILKHIANLPSSGDFMNCIFRGCCWVSLGVNQAFWYLKQNYFNIWILHKWKKRNGSLWPFCWWQFQFKIHI